MDRSTNVSSVSPLYVLHLQKKDLPTLLRYIPVLTLQITENTKILNRNRFEKKLEERSNYPSQMKLNDVRRHLSNSKTDTLVNFLIIKRGEIVFYNFSNMRKRLDSLNVKNLAQRIQTANMFSLAL